MTDPTDPPRPSMTRRNVLAGATAVVGAGAAGGLVWERYEGFRRAAVVVARAETYDGSLVEIVQRGLAELGFVRERVRGLSILLKPNLVEPSVEAPQVNTHPMVVRAVVEAFRRLDAREVFVAEGQGHVRDTQFVLEQSGLGRLLAEDGIEFVDLNHDEIFRAPNRIGFTGMTELMLPRSLQRADLVVSLPKLKTHHWTGVTLSMKNFFGVMPGICYGWPKNVLHQHGIPQSILDIVGTVKPGLAIVDGIIGMEGDGPIMGPAKRANVLVMGTDLVSVDATATRLMDLDPMRIDYLRVGARFLGPIHERNIEQRGERLASMRQRFELLDHPVMAHFRDR